MTKDDLSVYDYQNSEEQYFYDWFDYVKDHMPQLLSMADLHKLYTLKLEHDKHIRMGDSIICHKIIIEKIE